jgi:uncharacterized protein
MLQLTKVTVFPHCRTGVVRLFSGVNGDLSNNQIISLSERWVNRWVFKHGLCPWAGKVISEKTIRFDVFVESPIVPDGLIQLEDKVLQEIQFMNDKKNKVDTSVLVLTHLTLKHDFQTFLSVHERMEELLEEVDLDEHIQIATFHPNYQFAGTTSDSVENYTNRSPYPMLHLLKVEQVSNAIASVKGNTDKIWKRNIKLMKSMGEEEVIKTFNELCQCPENTE